jgi:hypothetical protein
MKPTALDLCCGKGGWTRGLLATGWDVIGVDIEQWEGYPKEADFVLMDVKQLLENIKVAKQLGTNWEIKLVVASPPCQEFSYRSFPFKRCRELAATVPPDTSIWEACERIARECKAPLVLENVRGAQKYMGRAAAHYGSFYLWGDVPAMLPIGRPIKGFCHNCEGRTKTRFAGENERGKYREFSRGETQHTNPKSNKRKQWSAQAAMIPIELSTWIGQCFYPIERKNKNEQT